MESDLKGEGNVNTKRSHPDTPSPNASQTPLETTPATTARPKLKTRDKGADSNTEVNATSTKRRCVSTACIACRKRKSKCDGQLPKCAACASVYLTECQYAPHTDHRRKGVYKKDVDGLKARSSTLQTLVHALLNSEEENVSELVRQIRTSDNLEQLADAITVGSNGVDEQDESPDSPVYSATKPQEVPRFEAELSRKMGDLLLQGSLKFIGGTSNLIWLPSDSAVESSADSANLRAQSVSSATVDDAVRSWTTVTRDKGLILHLMQMYFTWHYAYFTTLSKPLFYRDFLRGTPSQYCSSLLVNVMLSLGCHFTAWPAARDNPQDSATAGDHFFRQAQRLVHQSDEFATAKLCTVQALALMSVREAGCGREGKGWVYSGMSFRMATDLGLGVDAPSLTPDATLSAEDIDARRITFWGCFLFDKCWSNYLGRPPQLPLPSVSTPKPDIFPSEDGDMWSPYTDSGIVLAHQQPARTRAVARYISHLSEISSDLLNAFYHPSQLDKPATKQAELKRLCDLHTRLEAWKKELPQEMDPRDGQLAQILLMHMFFQLLFIHLYRPFLKYNRDTSPLPSHVSPRKYCTQAAGAISKLLRLYKRTYGLSHICNIAVYIAHSACTIHLLNLPDRNAKRDIIHGVKHLEEIGEMWICARRTLRILSATAEKFEAELPEEAMFTFSRTRSRWGSIDPEPSPSPSDSASPSSQPGAPPTSTSSSSLDPHIFITHSNSAAIPYLQDGLMVPDAPPSKRRPSQAPTPSSDHFLPHQAGATPSSGNSRLSQATQLTKAQQDAWNAHQTARLQKTTDRPVPSGSSATRAADPAVLFGGIESLVKESQNWWLKDQSALALGINNWMSSATSEPSATSQSDWSMAFSVPTTANGDTGHVYDYGVNEYATYADQSGQGK